MLRYYSYMKPETRIRPWSDLPADLLGEIAKRLSSADRVRFGAVCKNFSNLLLLLSNNHPMKDGDWAAIDDLPWLVRQRMERTPPRVCVFELFNPVQQQRQRVYSAHGTNSWDGVTVLASKNGWLFCCEGNPRVRGRVSCFSVSLFTKQTIRLPDLTHPPLDRPEYVQLAAMSSDPSSPDCVYFVMHQFFGDPWLTFVSTFRANGCGQWKSVRSKDCFLSGVVHSVVYHDGFFHWVSRFGNLEVFDMDGNCWRTLINSAPLSYGTTMRGFIRQCYLLVRQKKLLLVSLDAAVDPGKDADQCRVFEFCTSYSSWVPVTSLGDDALFLGLSSFAVSTVGLPASIRDGIANRVYYYHPSRFDEPRYCSLEDGRCHKSTHGSWFGGVDAGMWIEPPQLSTTLACLNQDLPICSRETEQENKQKK